MEQTENDLLTPFDKLISTRQLQMMKLMIPYIPPDNQRMMAVYIKFLELKNTMEFFQDFKKDISTQEFSKTYSSPLEILEEIKPYMPESEKGSMDSIINMMNMVEMYRSMSDGNGGEEENGGMDEQFGTE